MNANLQLLHHTSISGNGDEKVSTRRQSNPIHQATSRPRIILFVDDEPLVQKARRIIFEALGYFVLTAASGEEALEVLRCNTVDAVVLDYVMPGIDGEETARRIRMTNARIPIVFCSGHPALPESVSRIADAVVDKARVHALLALLEQLVEDV